MLIAQQVCMEDTSFLSFLASVRSLRTPSPPPVTAQTCPSSVNSLSPRLSQNLLPCALSACFTDGILPLDMEASELLSDTFDILSSKEIKLLAMRAQACKDLLEEDDMALANVVMQEAQMKIISQVCAHSAAPVGAVNRSPGAVLTSGFMGGWDSEVSALATHGSFRDSECVSTCLPGVPWCLTLTGRTELIISPCLVYSPSLS